MWLVFENIQKFFKDFTRKALSKESGLMNASAV